MPSDQPEARQGEALNGLEADAVSLPPASPTLATAPLSEEVIEVEEDLSKTLGAVARTLGKRHLRCWAQ